MWFKNKNIRIMNENMICAKQTWKQIFNMLTHANMNMKRTWEDYSARLCLKLMLNILKETKDPTFNYTFLRT
jgi:succinate dehydrogenase hydrophobic anchor subunit